MSKTKAALPAIPAIDLAEAKAGDLVLCHGTGIVARLIRFGQRLRVPKEYSYFNHVAILGTKDLNPKFGWMVFQAEGRGTSTAWLDEIGEYAVISCDSIPTVTGGPVDRASALAYAREALGVKYGFLTIASIVVNLLTPRFLDFHIDVRSYRTLICSAYGMRSLEHGGALSPVDPFQITPAEIAQLAATDPKRLSGDA